MSRKNHRRDYNGRQGSAQRPWEQERADWQNRGSMQRNQYDNIGRDRYGSNTGQGGGYGSHNWGRDDDEDGRPNWPGEQRSHQQHQSRQQYDARQQYGYGAADQNQGEEYGDQRYGRGSDSSRRYRSQGDHGMSRYQGNADERSTRGWGGDEGYENWGEGDSDIGSNNRGSQRNFQQGNWNRVPNFGSSQSGSRSMQREANFSGRGPKGYRRSDERIQEDINEQLTQHDEIDAGEIEVKVSNGEVTLTGTVDTRDAKRMAEDIAESVSGVTDVQNQIRVVKTVGAAREKENESEGNSSSSKSRNKTGTGVGA